MPGFSLVLDTTKGNEPWLLFQWGKQINQQKLQSNEQNAGNCCNQCVNEPFGDSISLSLQNTTDMVAETADISFSQL